MARVVTVKLLQMRASAACKHPTEKLMRGGFGGGATTPTGGLGGRTPQKLGLSGKIGSNTAIR